MALNIHLAAEAAEAAREEAQAELDEAWTDYDESRFAHEKASATLDAISQADDTRHLSCKPTLSSKQPTTSP